MPDQEDPTTRPGVTEGGGNALKYTLHDLLWEVSAYAEMRGEAALADLGLTLPSNGLLDAIVNEPGVTVAEMSRRIPKTQQAISQVVTRLERGGFVERRVGSGRGVGLYPTEAGRAISAHGVERELGAEAEMRELLGDERYESLRALLLEARPILRGQA
jgi:DNA-binding MarR family transcriptional regulator